MTFLSLPLGRRDITFETMWFLGGRIRLIEDPPSGLIDLSVPGALPKASLILVSFDRPFPQALTGPHQLRSITEPAEMNLREPAEMN